MTDPSQDNYWITGTSGEAPETSGECPLRRRIGNVAPPADRFSAAWPENVPHMLREILFGAGTPAAPGARPAPLVTYAVLDAARISGLAEIITSSGLDYACLFQGKAGQEFGDVAPWLVRLEEAHPFTRGLFASGKAPWQMRDRAAFILLRSRSAPDALQRHLKRFTRFEEESGRWVFFRFCDPVVMDLYLDEADLPHQAGLFWGLRRGGLQSGEPQNGDPQKQIIERLVYPLGPDWFEVSCPGPHPAPRARVDAAAAQRIALAAAADRELAALIARGALAHAVVPESQFRQIARSVVMQVHPLGFRGRFHLRYFIAWSLMRGPVPEPVLAEIRQHMADTGTPVDIRFQAISLLIRPHLARPMEALFG